MKRCLVIICVFFILILSLSFISAGFFSDIWNKITGKVVEDCDDSDGHLGLEGSYYVKGTACAANGCFTDSCVEEGGSVLREFSCSLDERVVYLRYTCPGGSTCSEGVCGDVCVAETCASLGYECGTHDDGCGGSLDCDVCPSGEICSNGKCIEEGQGCVIFYLDADGDSYGVTDNQCLESAAGDYTASQSGDCDDSDLEINPLAEEVCDDSLDNNCDGNVDEGCVVEGEEVPGVGDEEVVEGAEEITEGDIEEVLGETEGSGACIPETEICDDEIDNDCDELVDYDDMEDCSRCERTDTSCYYDLEGEACVSCASLEPVDLNCNFFRTKLKARTFGCGAGSCEESVLRSVIEDCGFGCSEDEEGAHCMTQEESEETSLFVEFIVDIFVASEEAETVEEVEETISACVPETEICDDEIDNDCDELVDYDDVEECVVVEEVVEEEIECFPEVETCEDEIDNDCDGEIDEVGCSSVYIIQFYDAPLAEKEYELENQIKELEATLYIAEQEPEESGGVFQTRSLNEISKELESINLEEEMQEHEEVLEDTRNSFKNKILSDKSITGSAVEGEVEDIIVAEYKYALNGMAIRLTPEMAAEVEGYKGVKSVSKSMKMEFALDNSVPLMQANIVWIYNNQDRLCRDEKNCLTGKGIKVAIIDSGIDYTHPAFGSCTKEEIDGGNCEKIGLVKTYASSFDALDLIGHGTHVAGIIAAKTDLDRDGSYCEVDEGEICGIAPDSELYIYQLSDSDSFGEYVVASAIDDAVSQGVDIISISVTFYPSVMPMLDNPANKPLCVSVANAFNAGIFVVAAAGNRGPNKNTVGFPAGCIKTFAVGNFDNILGLRYGGEKLIHWSSSRGPISYIDPKNNYVFTYPKPDIVAPGREICSANPLYMGEEFGDKTCVSGFEDEINRYRWGTGTSMATPHVAGVAALLKQAKPDLTAYELWDILKDGALGEDVFPGFKTIFDENDRGAGFLHAYEAYNKLMDKMEKDERIASNYYDKNCGGPCEAATDSFRTLTVDDEEGNAMRILSVNRDGSVGQDCTKYEDHFCSGTNLYTKTRRCSDGDCVRRDDSEAVVAVNCAEEEPELLCNKIVEDSRGMFSRGDAVYEHKRTCKTEKLWSVISTGCSFEEEGTLVEDCSYGCEFDVEQGKAVCVDCKGLSSGKKVNLFTRNACCDGWKWIQKNRICRASNCPAVHKLCRAENSNDYPGCGVLRDKFCQSSECGTFLGITLFCWNPACGQIYKLCRSPTECKFSYNKFCASSECGTKNDYMVCK